MGAKGSTLRFMVAPKLGIASKLGLPTVIDPATADGLEQSSSSTIATKAADDISKKTKDDHLPKKPVDAVVTASVEEVAATESSNMPGWLRSMGFKDAGRGFCEDSESRQEFSSLNAEGTTLQDCARVAKNDHGSIAFDFADAKGKCDVRYPAGVLAMSEPGYTYWAWGGGVGSPAGFGRDKHEVPTHCYAKILQPTPAPTLPPPPPLSAEELAVLVQRGKGRFSIVLACASEGDFMVKTIRSFCERTPSEILQEIIVVDDGSEPPLEGLLGGIDKNCRLRVLRHADTLGLMIAKQTGGDAATGEFIGFFDCHVAPNRGWYKELIEVIQGGPRRMAVPIITDLDLDAWNEKPQSQENSKCYIDFGANFMWYDDGSPYIPVISGGLVALSRSWWHESGGFDNKMRGWGGENIDQSLRTWLCGGEILRARSSRVAHMWRIPEDPRTASHYKRVAGGGNNIARVAAAWFDKFLVKFADGNIAKEVAKGGGPDVSNYRDIKERLHCKSYGYFLHRFRKVYKDGGLLPDIVFKIRSMGSDRCIKRAGEKFAMGPCSEASWFHLANRDRNKNHQCCSGIRQWNAMECFDRLDPTGPLAYWCDIGGTNDNQQYFFGDDGFVRHPLDQKCLIPSPDGGSDINPSSCAVASRWEKIDSFVPEETAIYASEVKRLQLSDNSPDN